MVLLVGVASASYYGTCHAEVLIVEVRERTVVVEAPGGDLCGQGRSLEVPRPEGPVEAGWGATVRVDEQDGMTGEGTVTRSTRAWILDVWGPAEGCVVEADVLRREGDPFFRVKESTGDTCPRVNSALLVPVPSWALTSRSGERYELQYRDGAWRSEPSGELVGFPPGTCALEVRYANGQLEVTGRENAWCVDGPRQLPAMQADLPTDTPFWLSWSAEGGWRRWDSGAWSALSREPGHPGRCSVLAEVSEVRVLDNGMSVARVQPLEATGPRCTLGLHLREEALVTGDRVPEGTVRLVIDGAHTGEQFRYVEPEPEPRCNHTATLGHGPALVATSDVYDLRCARLGEAIDMEVPGYVLPGAVYRVGRLDGVMVVTGRIEGNTIRLPEEGMTCLREVEAGAATGVQSVGCAGVPWPPEELPDGMLGWNGESWSVVEM